MLRSLMCLCLLVASAYAGGNGYNYAASVPQPQVLAPPLAAPAPAPASFAPQQYSEPAPAASYQHVQQAAAPVRQEISKDFYYFNAPEEHIDRHAAQASQPAPTVVKKHLNVVIIKAPENRAYEKALRNAVANTVEETKTHIYVLSKQPNYGALRKAVQQQQQYTHQSHKPEVHFVKYRTPAEAQQTQQQIVQQYGGGHVVNLGGGGGSSGGQQFAATNVNRQYLAPSAGAGDGGAQFAATNVNRQYLAPPTNTYIPPKFF